MADEHPDATYLKMQEAEAATQGYTAGNENANGGADDESDTDDYDPSAIMQEDYAIPFDVSQKKPASSDLPSTSNAPVATSNSGLSTPLPQDSQVPSRSASRLSAPQVSSAPVPSQIQSRTKGGFVLESDEEDAGDEQKEDSVDPYEPSDSADPNDPASGVIQTTTDTNAQGQASLEVTNGTSNGLSMHSAQIPASSSTPNPSSVVQAQTVPLKPVSTPVPVAPKTRLPNDVIGILEDRIQEDPRGDMDAWLSLIREYRDRNKQSEARAVYDRFFKVFPSSAEQLTAQVEWESANNNLYYVEQVFQKSLLSVPHVDLWSTYLQYVRRRNNVMTDPDGRAYRTIAESFDFALKNVGMDKDSGSIWQEYIDFLKSGPGTVGGNGWQDTQKMDSLRAAYQRAITVPMSALNTLWKEYEGFEMGINKLNGRKFMQEKAPAYMTARSSYTQLQNLTRNLNRTTLPRLPPAPGYEGEAEYMQQVDIWKGWIRWEKEDPLVLKDEEPQNFKNRILFVYRQALMALRFWPEMWHDAAEWSFQNDMPQDGDKFLDQGMDANPESCLLAFKRADRLEQTTTNGEGQDPGAKVRMAKVQVPYNKVLDALYDLYNKTRSKEAQEIASVQASLADADSTQPYETSPYGDELEDTRNGEAKAAAVQAQVSNIKKSYSVRLEMLSKTLSHAWIALTRAARRIQSKTGFRAIFALARKRGKVTSELYVETALIEYHCYKDPAGTRIFERGMKLFPEDEHFALAYLKHLIAINDITNARAVFETTVGKLTATPATVARAKPIFNFLHEYESHFGELAQVVKLEKRMSELYPEDSALNSFAKRYISRGFDPTEVRPVVSSTQTRGSSTVHTSFEAVQATPQSPAVRLIEPQTTDSPKRPFVPDEADDGLNPPRKFVRGESPLKGAAGRRMDQQKRSQTGLSQQFQPPPPLPTQLALILSIIPKAMYYNEIRFEPSEMVRLIRDTRLPESYAALQQERAARQQQQSYYAPPPMPLPNAGMPQAMGQPPYGQYRY